MATSPNKLSQFWQELKRRRVTRTVTVYAAAAFVILELVSIIVEPLKLPEWTLPFVIVLLCVGFIIAVILSWIYDVQPEGGIVKTEPAHKVNADDFPKSSKSWRIASYISFVVIVGLIVLNIIPRSGKKEILDKSIAVLPFRNDSPDEEKMYFINGTMEAILNNLCKIADLRVPGRTSVEQYRDNPKPIPTVAAEMNVSYILEGSGQKLGDRILLTVQLLDGINDRHLWSKQYDREIQKIEEIIDIQSEIAQLVAAEIEAIITQEEEKSIKHIPTTSLIAYELYLKGREEFLYYYADRKNIKALKRAEDLYRLALEYDPTFAKAYTGLASIYWFKGLSGDYNWQDCLDSLLILANYSLAYDDQLADAFHLRANYYRHKDMNEEAIKEFDKALKLNPNSWMLYNDLGFYYLNNNPDYIRSLENFHKAASLIRGPELPTFLRRSLGNAYNRAGFPEKAEFYYLEAMKLDGDSMAYYSSSVYNAYFNGIWENAVAGYEYMLQTDSTNPQILHQIGESYMYLGKYEESLKYLRKWFTEGSKSFYFWYQGIPGLAYVYLRNGFEKEADYHFRESVKHFNKVIEQAGPETDQWTYYGLAEVYAYMGEKDKAYENLRMFVEKVQAHDRISIIRIKNDPLFDSIRDEPEFQHINRYIEAKCQAEHERVKQWLEENDML